ncbi:MAG: GIY-YIG nuclease family protein [Polaromonas sp.]|uniref:GIY-YIG nuclease family protein n=1 Tax=Polaromonas sp. TaxID=1869339 RepID=UPI0024880B02|nr:GIY-YIG nuclease family protein [Polaromonas sp.]MDI1238499.1 GIY-YIG nuclease family protein [Polaromonas sp.]
MAESRNPFSLRIFVADGDPDGLRLVERSNWVGKALMFPRALLPQVKQRPELNQTGVYLLLGPREDGEGDMLYIGEGDPIKPRLENHYAQKDFWTRAVCFVATPGQLNKAHVQFLESNLVRLAKTAKRLPLDNGNHPAEPTLSEADRADMLVFLDNMLGMLPVLGVHAFELPAKQAATPTAQLTCKGKGIVATGYEGTQGFVVKAGSQAVAEAVPSMQLHVRGMYDTRQKELIANGVLVPESAAPGSAYRLTQDYVFSSPSTAAAVLLGRSANGRIEWKDAFGRTLKELQAMEAGL